MMIFTLLCNKTKLFPTVLILIFLFSIDTIKGQETNYWSNNYGASSFLKGGIVVADVSSNSAIFYNPGALAFFKGQAIEAQADLITLDAFNIQNGAGDDIPIQTISLDVSPSLIGYSTQSKSNPKIVYGFGVFTKNISNLSFNIRHETQGNYLSSTPNNDIFHGELRYQNRATENWVNGTVAYQLTPKIGIGLATNVVIKIQDYINSYNATVRENNASNPIPATKFAMVNHLQDFSFRSIGFVFKPGINIDLSPIKIGATITTPNLSLGLLNNQSNRRSTEILPDTADKITNNANSHINYAGVYNTPWIFDLGLEYQFNKTKINTMVGFFSKVNSYRMISSKQNSEDFSESFSDDPTYAVPFMASKQILNFGISIDHKLQNDLNFLLSFRTDFNHFDDTQLNRTKDYVPNMAFWDIYHLSTGLMTTTKNFKISLGFNYGLGLSKNDSQIVNMATISQANRLLGDINNNTSTTYHNVALMFGLSYTVNAKIEEIR